MNLDLMEIILEIICLINLDEYSKIGTHWKALYANAQTITYSDSFRVEHISKEIEKFFKKYTDKVKIVTNTFRIQGYGSVMCG